MAVGQVRMTHVPTGVSVYCADERSQHMNRAKALKILAGPAHTHTHTHTHPSGPTHEPGQGLQDPRHCRTRERARTHTHAHAHSPTHPFPRARGPGVAVFGARVVCVCVCVRARERAEALCAAGRETLNLLQNCFSCPYLCMVVRADAPCAAGCESDDPAAEPSTGLASRVPILYGHYIYHVI